MFAFLLAMLRDAPAPPPVRCESGAHAAEDNCDCWIGRPHPCCRCGVLRNPDGERCERPCPAPDDEMLRRLAFYDGAPAPREG